MKLVGQKEIKIDNTFAEEIRSRCGENVFLCYQCRKCASGCPSRTFMEGTPAELMRYVQLGMVDEAMKDNTIWYCLSCQTCSARCPQNIDIAHIVDTIKILAQEKKIKADTKHEMLFNWLWMRMLKYMGRIYELGLTAMLNGLSGRPFKDLPLGIRMIRKGKLKLLPSVKKSLTMIKMFSRAKRLRK